MEQIKKLFGSCIMKMISHTGYDNISTSYQTIKDIPVVSLEQLKYKKLSDLVEGKNLFLVVNLASK